MNNTETRPLLLAFGQENGDTRVIIPPYDDMSYQHYGVLIAEMIQHVARMQGVSTKRVKHWVDVETRQQTRTVSGGLVRVPVRGGVN